MIMDFEKAAINAFQIEWPTTTVKGSYFHFTQNLWRKIQELGLQTDYDEQLVLRLRMVLALAFPPPFEVQELFPQVTEQLVYQLLWNLRCILGLTTLVEQYQVEHS